MFREKISADRRTQVLVNNLAFKLFNLSIILYHSPVPLLSLIILNIFSEKTLQQDMMEFFQGARGEDFHDITLMLDGEPIGAHKVSHSCCCHFLCHSVCIIFREIPLGKFVSEKMLNRSFSGEKEFQSTSLP